MQSVVLCAFSYKSERPCILGHLGRLGWRVMGRHANRVLDCLTVPSSRSLNSLHVARSAAIVLLSNEKTSSTDWRKNPTRERSPWRSALVACRCGLDSDLRWSRIDLHARDSHSSNEIDSKFRCGCLARQAIHCYSFQKFPGHWHEDRGCQNHSRLLQVIREVILGQMSRMARACVPIWNARVFSQQDGRSNGFGYAGMGASHTNNN
jgi:hypothetical protein